MAEWNEEHLAGSAAEPHHRPCEHMSAEQARPRPAPAAPQSLNNEGRGGGGTRDGKRAGTGQQQQTLPQRLLSR